ncbi:MAG TPA: hypothetical protein VFM18_00845, partial [Methanosarcina sp.]|nr:hypothetical protein [Methanosarcina sp.]
SDKPAYLLVLIPTLFLPATTYYLAYHLSKKDWWLSRLGSILIIMPFIGYEFNKCLESIQFAELSSLDFGQANLLIMMVAITIVFLRSIYYYILSSILA